MKYFVSYKQKTSNGEWYHQQEVIRGHPLKYLKSHEDVRGKQIEIMILFYKELSPKDLKEIGKDIENYQ